METISAAESVRLGRFEFLAMNNPLKRWVQKHWEFRIFLRMLERQGVDLHGKAIMDAGCGSGYGTELILRRLRPGRIFAFDLMPEQIELAKRRGLPVDFRVGDATRMEEEDSSCDGVFIFGILHHIPSWRQALKETARVLKPGGVLLVEEPLYRFTWPELEAGIREAGMEIAERKAWLFGNFHSYLCKVNKA